MWEVWLVWMAMARAGLDHVYVIDVGRISDVSPRAGVIDCPTARKSAARRASHQPVLIYLSYLLLGESPLHFHRPTFLNLSHLSLGNDRWCMCWWLCCVWGSRRHLVRHCGISVWLLNTRMVAVTIGLFVAMTKCRIMASSWWNTS